MSGEENSLRVDALSNKELALFDALRGARLDAAVENALRNWNLDVGETAMFTRQQEQILAEPFNVEYADIQFRNIIPVDNQIDPGAQSWTYRQFDEAGSADLITDWSANFPTVDVKGEETEQKIKSFGTSYHYSVQELRNNDFGRRSSLASSALGSVDVMRSAVARRVIERLVDKMAAVGEARYGFSSGLANNSNVSTFTLSTKVGNPASGGTPLGTEWFDANGKMLATPAEILGDVNGMAKKIFVDTKQLYAPDTLVVGTQTFAALAGTPQSPNFTSESVMSYILRMSPWIKSIKPWNRLDTAGTSSKERMICMKAGKDIARVMIPVEFEQFAPLQQNLAFRVLCHMRYAGVAVFRPKAMLYADGAAP